MEVDFHGGHARLYFGLYERELAGYFRRFCTAGARSFDVGAQYGYDALVMAKLTRAAVVSFECDARLCEAVMTNARLNPQITDSVSVINGYVTHRSDQHGAVSIDDAARKTFYPEVIKIDIEGGEVDALLGASAVLEKTMPSLIVEVHSQALEYDCLEILTEAGYRPAIVDQRRWLPDHRPIAHNRWIVAEGKAVAWNAAGKSKRP